MTRRRARPTVASVPPITAPKPPWTLRWFGVLAMVVIVISICTTDPRPGPHGDGPWVALGLAALIAGIVVSFPRTGVPVTRRLGALMAVAVATCVLTVLQPHSAAYAGVFYIAAVGSMRLPERPAAALFFSTLGALIVISLAVQHRPAGDAASLVFSTLPWFLIVRLMRELRAGRDRAEELVEELQESRAAHAAAAAEGERSR
ncbi:MAG: hypothetical protein QOE28_332, partial [Solirubrobacteraceae bacterium]|nr:hypothetical protein [Solirubrobacteraceae bacterium]